MSKTPRYDAKVKAILDTAKPGERVCELTGEKWFMDEEEIGWYRKFNVPPSKHSPRTRQLVVNSYFVIFDIWYNRHIETGRPIISNIHPATGIRVLPDKEWYEKDFISAGRDLDLNQPFLRQFYALGRSVPRAAGYNYVPPENSIAFISFGDQDSYFVLACKSKRTFYSINAQNTEDCAECSILMTGQKSYNVIHSERIYNCRFVRESQDCINCDFIFDCRNCENCFGATNKRNKKYLWFNEQLDKDEWQSRKTKIDLSSYQALQTYREKFHELIQNAIWPENFNVHAENSTGEYLHDVSNLRNCFHATAKGSKNLKNCSYIVGAACHDCYFCAAPISSSDAYYGVGMNESKDVKFSTSVNNRCFDAEYCESCFDIEHCFGCVGLRNKKYCILNKQYEEEDYWRTVDALKCAMLDRGEYGDLPLANFSTQVCMSSGAGILYGATEEDCRMIKAAKFAPSDEGAEGLEIDANRIEPASAVPDRIAPDQFDEIAGRIFFDEKMGRRYVYLKPELELYDKLGVAAPRRHPTGRVHDLYAEMNMPLFSDTECKKCGKIIRVAKNHSYPRRTIYCKPCYLKYLEETT